MSDLAAVLRGGLAEIGEELDLGHRLIRKHFNQHRRTHHFGALRRALRTVRAVQEVVGGALPAESGQRPNDWSEQHEQGYKTIGFVLADVREEGMTDTRTVVGC